MNSAPLVPPHDPEYLALCAKANANVVAYLRDACGGAVLCWQLPRFIDDADGGWEPPQAFESALAAGVILCDTDTDLYYLPGFDIAAERENQRAAEGIDDVAHATHAGPAGGFDEAGAA